MSEQLPTAWASSTLGEMLLAIEAGRSFKAHTRRASSHEWGVIKVSAMTWGEFRPTENKAIPSGTEVDPRWIIRSGDLLLSRANTHEYVGATVLVEDTPGNLVLSDKSMRLVPSGQLDKRWLLYFLSSPQARAQLSHLASGTKHSMRNVSQEKVRSVGLPVPPRDEQRRIVRVIDEQLSRLDGAIRLVNSALIRLPFIRRAVLGEVMPGPLPEGWKLLTVDESGTVDLGRQRSPKYHSGPNMKPYLRVANVHEDRIDLRDVKEMDFPLEQLARHELRPGDILLNEGNGSPELVGSPAMYRGELPGACFTNSLIRFRPFDFVDGEYALLVFLRHLRFGRFQSAAQITTIAHMAAGRFKCVEFPVPPLDEQRAIVLEVRRHLSLLAAFESQLKFALKRSETLRRAILAAGFRGELVSQDPSDEPASDLLARIAAERPTPASRTRKKNGA